MDRSTLINNLITKYGYKRYLEIGVFKGKNLSRVQAPHKDSVDPAGNCNFKMTSDAFFEQLGPEVKYDLVFIDGLHTKEQVLKDVDNALKHLNEGGMLVLHDCNPARKEHATEKHNGRTWNGTVWQAVVQLRRTRADLSIHVVDSDHGCGLVCPGQQELLKTEDVSWAAFEAHRKEYLNLITVDEFVKLYLGV